MRDQLGVRIGYGAGTAMTSVAQVAEEARWAEAAGFDAFWVSQVFGVDPVVALAAQALTAQQALDGRFTLGVGTSHQVVAESLFGESFARPFTRASEHLAALLPLLRGEPAAVSGDEVVAHGALTIPAPPVPLLLAALGPRMLEVAGRLTAGTSVGQCGPRTIATHVAPRLAEAAAAAGRPAPRLVALVTVGVTTEPERRREELRRGSALYDSFASYRTALDREGVASGADLVLLGSIDVVAEGLAAYAEAGATDLRIAIAAADAGERAATREALAELLAR